MYFLQSINSHGITLQKDCNYHLIMLNYMGNVPRASVRETEQQILGYSYQSGV